MGKRKRRSEINKAPPPPPDFVPQASQVDLQPELRSSEQAESSATQSLASIMDAMDRSLRRSPAHQSHLNQSHSISLRHSRHPFGRHYSRRSSINQSDASPSNWKGTPMYDALKLGIRDLSNFPYRDGSGERIFRKPDRIRSNSLSQNGVSGEFRKMECRICQKRLKKNPCIIDSSIQANDVSVVAVLVCGHAYHADCLEQKTSHEERQDPPCPMCVGQLASADDV